MKRKIFVIFIILLGVLCIFAFGGCNKHEHAFAEKWSSDATYHWHAATCEHQREITDKQMHTFKGGKCTVCSYRVGMHKHLLGSALQSDSMSHWRSCIYCGMRDEVTNHIYGEAEVLSEPTCTSKGSGKQICQVCNYEFTGNIATIPHAIGENHVCSMCNETIYYIVEKDGAHLTFGEYPQTQVTDVALETMLNLTLGSLPTKEDTAGWTDYGYYQSGIRDSYFWYRDVTYNSVKYRAVYGTAFRPTRASKETPSYNEQVYKFGDVYWFKFEPIRWRILTRSAQDIFVIGDIALDAREFNASLDPRVRDDKVIYPNNYKESDIRKWLNDEFAKTAFDDVLMSKIEIGEVDNSTPFNGNDDYLCENTFDKVFLPSIAETTNVDYGFLSSFTHSNTARYFEASDYAKTQGVHVFNVYSDLENPSFQDTVQYGRKKDVGILLRTPTAENGGDKVYVYNTFGEGQSHYSDIMLYGIVPALRLKV